MNPILTAAKQLLHNEEVIVTLPTSSILLSRLFGIYYPLDP